jgi:hypothetical protein
MSSIRIFGAGKNGLQPSPWAQTQPQPTPLSLQKKEKKRKRTAYPFPNKWSSSLKLQDTHNVLPIDQWFYIPHFFKTYIPKQMNKQTNK